MLYNYREELEITTMASERNIQKDYQVNLDLHILLAHSLEQTLLLVTSFCNI